MGELSTELSTSRASTVSAAKLQTKVKHWTTTSASSPIISYAPSRDSAVRGQTQMTTSVPPTYSYPFSTSSVTASIVRETALVASDSTGSTIAGNGDLQTITTGSPSMSSTTHRTTTTSDDHRPAESATMTIGTNTWVVATAAEVSSSSIATLSFFTSGGTNSTSTLSLESTSSATSDVASSTFSNAVPDTSSLAQSAHIGGTTSASKIGTIAGATAGAVVVILLILLAAFAYVRGGAMRGLSSNAHSKISRLHSSLRRAPLVDKGHEKIYRQETNEVRPHDLETATVSSGSHYDDIQDGWEEVDLRGARTGEMGKDKGEWLESWRMGRERMMTTSGPPTLTIDPQIPLPPIDLKIERRKSDM